MAPRQPVRIWYDREGDFLEVMFARRAGYFRETASDQVMVKVDRRGKPIGFHVLRVSQVRRPLAVRLAAARSR